MATAIVENVPDAHIGRWFPCCPVLMPLSREELISDDAAWTRDVGSAWPWIVGALALGCAVAGWLCPLIDPDLPVHLRTGEWILREGRFPFTEPFAWTRSGAPFFAYSWLAELLYLGAGQNPGDTLVYFPQEKVIFSGGPFSKNSWANPQFTPSMTNWVDLLRRVAAMDIDKYLGGHGDIGEKQDVLNEAQMLADFDAGMRAAVKKGLSREEIFKSAPFEKYKDVRNYYRMNLFINSYYHFLTTGRPEVALPD